MHLSCSSLSSSTHVRNICTTCPSGVTGSAQGWITTLLKCLNDVVFITASLSPGWIKADRSIGGARSTSTLGDAFRWSRLRGARSKDSPTGGSYVPLATGCMKSNFSRICARPGWCKAAKFLFMTAPRVFSPSHLGGGFVINSARSKDRKSGQVLVNKGNVFAAILLYQNFT